MLVQEWMTKDVLTITPETSIMKASRLMKDNKVRRLPVVDGGRRVIGIVSQTDIKDSSPSKATTLDMHELYYLLSELKVADIMTKAPFCAHENDSVENVALVMTERRFGGVPVVDAENKIVGIITESDIFKVLASITGVRFGGMQLVFEIPTREGTLRPILDALRERGAGMISVLTAQQEEDSATRRVYIRLRPMPAEREEELVGEIKALFSSFIYCERAPRDVPKASGVETAANHTSHR